MSCPTRQQTPAVTPRQIMGGHTHWVRGVVHLPCGRRIITGSFDGSIRLWDLESGTQIGDSWRDEENETGVNIIALSPNGITVASGSRDGTVRLWDVKTRSIIARWKGHTWSVLSVCWSADGERVVSGSDDGTVRVWDFETGKTVVGPIKTGHKEILAVMYLPDTSKIATRGYDENDIDEDAVKVWDANTGRLLTTIKHDEDLYSLAWTWTLDETKLFSGSSDGLIGIFNTVTWEQIATLEGHHDIIKAVSLSRTNRLLVSTSLDKTARLWNLDTNLPVGPPLQHKNGVDCAAFSDDGKVLVTGCRDHNTYVWDVHAILNEAGHGDLLSIPDMARTGLKRKSYATRRPAQLKNTGQLPRGFLDVSRDGDRSSMTHGIYPPKSSAHRPHGSLSSLFRRSQQYIGEENKFQRHQRTSFFSLRRDPRTVEVAAVKDKQVCRFQSLKSNDICAGPGCCSATGTRW